MLRRRRPALSAMVVLATVVPLVISTGASAAAASASPKKAAPATPVSVPADARAAVAKRPTDLLVAVDATAALTSLATSPGRFQPGRVSKGAPALRLSFRGLKTAAVSAAGSGVSIVKDFPNLPVALVRVRSAQALTALAKARGVTTIALPHKVRPVDSASDLSVIHQPAAAAGGATGAGTTVATVDTGLDLARPGVGGAFGSCADGAGSAGCRVIDVVDLAGSGQPDSDPQGHGTNVAGIVAATAPEARILAYNVFTSDGAGGFSATDTRVLTALDRVSSVAPTYNVRAVNLSLVNPEAYFTSECDGSIYSSTFLALRARGVLPVVAAGNDAQSGGDFRNGVHSPACATGAVRVGAVYDQAGPSHSYSGCTDVTPAALQVACFSQTGPLLNVLAPGVDVSAAGITMSGTSQAAPHVAGAVAAAVSANPSATAQQAFRAITSSGQVISDGRTSPPTSVHLLDVEAAATAITQPLAEVHDPGCSAHQLERNDDGSTDLVDLPFPINFFGTTYSGAYVNNNGNLTFSRSMRTFTPFTLTANTPPIIAPFFADVDTRGGAGVTTFGTATYAGRQAFCATWDNVGYFAGHVDKLNSFQVLLVDRSDVGAGDFDIVFNYDQLVWETGDASGGSGGFYGTPAGAGFSSGGGDAAHFFQFPGSLHHAGLLDANPAGLVNSSRGSFQPGRYVFDVRNGSAPGVSSISGRVVRDDGAPLPNASVQACSAAGDCVVGVSGSDGGYTILSLAPGDYDVRAYPANGSHALAGHAGPITVGEGEAVPLDLVLQSVQRGMPAGTTITHRSETEDGNPVILWTDDLDYEVAGCAGGTASYTVTRDGEVIRQGTMTEEADHAGTYYARIAAFYPEHGNVHISGVVTCPDGLIDRSEMDAYIDPSGAVVDQNGAPVEGATVTLLRSDSADGTFAPLPSGSSVMSPGNRTNPWTTPADGSFHWDVLAGFYQVTAAKSGCVAADGSALARSQVYEIPPPALGIELHLVCDGSQPVATVTDLTSDPVRPEALAPVVLRATVTGGSSPSGTVAFRDGPQSIEGCEARPVSAGTATCETSFVWGDDHSLLASYSGDATHLPSTASRTVTVTRVTPVITWPAPAPITYPTALGSGQLNASAGPPGRLEYQVDDLGAAEGVVLEPGEHTIRVLFTPTNEAVYTSAQAQRTITVLKKSQFLTFAQVPLSRSTQHEFEVGDLASASSGLPVTFDGSGACSVTPTGHVTVTGSGGCVIVARQQGDAHVREAAPAPQGVLVRLVSLSADKATRLPALPATLTASTPGAGAGEHLRIVDLAGDRVVKDCAAGATSCSATDIQLLGGHTYVAQLVSSSGAVLGRSATTTVTWKLPIG